jgi:hypothetical protein
MGGYVIDGIKFTLIQALKEPKNMPSKRRHIPFQFY